MMTCNVGPTIGGERVLSPCVGVQTQPSLCTGWERGGTATPPAGGPAALEPSYGHVPVPRGSSWAVGHQLQCGRISAPGVPCLPSCNAVVVARSWISSVSLITSVLHSSRPFIRLTPFCSGVACLEEFNGGKLQKAWFGENK